MAIFYSYFFLQIIPSASDIKKLGAVQRNKFNCKTDKLDKQTNIQTYKQKHRQTGKQTNRKQTNRQKK